MDLTSFGPLVGSLIQAGSPMISTALQMGIGEIPIVGGIVGPLVGMAAPQIVRMIATQLGAPADATPAQITAKIQDDPQGARAALASLESQHQFALAQQKQADDYAVTSQAQQVAIGTAEVENPSFFLGGARPAIMWGLGGLMMLSFCLPYPLWLATWFGAHPPPPPTIDPQALYILGALLGVTVVSRSVDKAIGTQTVGLGPGSAKVSIAAKKR